MIRSVLTLSALAAALALSGCASEPSTPVKSSAPAVPDTTIASKLKGNWTGDWTMPGYGGGKFELMVTDVTGTDVKGSANWYGTAAGDVKAPLTKANVKNGTLYGEQPGGWSFKLSMKDDKTLTGTWSVGGYSGPLKVSR